MMKNWNVPTPLTDAATLAPDGVPNQFGFSPFLKLSHNDVDLLCHLAAGRTNVQIDHFGAFFLRSKVSGGSGGDIEAA